MNEKIRKSSILADSLTVSRMLFSLLLLVFPPSSSVFFVLYLLCGVTDILDGFLARKLHTESERGARLDSTADLFFSVVYAVKILPGLSLPFWIWIWTAVIAVAKTAGILQKSRKKRGLSVEHSFLNKLTGLLIFLLPLSIRVLDAKYGAVVICAAAAFAAIEEIIRYEK